MLDMRLAYAYRMSKRKSSSGGFKLLAHKTSKEVASEFTQQLDD